MTDHETRRRELWSRVFRQSIYSDDEQLIDKAAKLADAALDEFDKRFHPPKQENSDDSK